MRTALNQLCAPCEDARTKWFISNRKSVKIDKFSLLFFSRHAYLSMQIILIRYSFELNFNFPFNSVEFPYFFKFLATRLAGERRALLMKTKEAG